MQKKKLSIDKIMFLVLITTIIALHFSVSKYRTISRKESTASVAKWNNGLELIDTESIILTNGSENSENVRFNVTSNSDVTSDCDIVFRNVPKEIGIILDNGINKCKCDIDDESITVFFKLNNVEEIATFNISDNNKVINTANCEIWMTTENTSKGKVISFKNNLNDLAIRAEIENGKNPTIVFEKFNKFVAGTNKNIEHTATFSTKEQNIPDISEIELYASFEQID